MGNHIIDDLLPLIPGQVRDYIAELERDARAMTESADAFREAAEARIAELEAKLAAIGDGR